MIVRLPFDPRSPKHRPLKEICDWTGEKLGVQSHLVALIMSCFLECLAARVAMGKTVRLPGFGIFAAGVRRPRSKCEGDEPYSVVRFKASRGFQREIRLCCTPSQIREGELQRYARRQAPSSRQTRRNSTVFGTQFAFRQEINEQLEASGMDSIGK